MVSLPVTPVTHRLMLLVAPALAGGSGHVGLVPFDHDRDEVARRNRAESMTGRAVVVVAPVGSKFSRYSPAVGPLVDEVAKFGAVFS